jgi:hypothetical protein
VIRALCILGMRPEAIRVALRVIRCEDLRPSARVRGLGQRPASALAAVVVFEEEVIFGEHTAHCQDLSAPECALQKPRAQLVPWGQA